MPIDQTNITKPTHNKTPPCVHVPGFPPSGNISAIGKSLNLDTKKKQVSPNSLVRTNSGNARRTGGHRPRHRTEAPISIRLGCGHLSLQKPSATVHSHILGKSDPEILRGGLNAMCFGPFPSQPHPSSSPPALKRTPRPRDERQIGQVRPIEIHILNGAKTSVQQVPSTKWIPSLGSIPSLEDMPPH